MTNYYVSKTGNNGNAGTSLASAWGTVMRACTAGSGVVAGDIVNINDGTYSESVTISVSGSSIGNRITYRAINKWLAKIACPGTLVSTNTTAAIQVNGNYVIIQDLDVTGNGAMGINCSGNWDAVKGCNVHDIPATGCTGFGGTGIGFDQYNLKEGGSACYNVVHSIGPLGTNCFRVQGIYTSIGKVTMNNNLVYKVVGYGFTQGHCSYSIHCINNTIFSCGGTVEGGGIVFTGNTNCGLASNNNVVTNNIIYDCMIGVHEEGVGAADTTIYAHNLVNGCSVANWGAMTNSHRDDVNSSPLFVNYVANGSGDYNITSASPAKDVGTSTYAPALDLSGVARPQNTKWDLGAYEILVGGPPPDPPPDTVSYPKIGNIKRVFR